MTSFGYRNDPVYITDNSVANIRIWTESGVGSLATSNSNTILRMNSPGPLSLGSGGVADRFYMTSFGNVGIGTTNPALHGTTALTVSANTTWSPLEVDNGLSYTGATNCSDGCRLIELYGAGSWMGEVSVRGGTAYYSNGSDRRLKDNIEAVDPVEALNRLMNLPVRSFNFKAFPDGQRMEGFLADEAQSIVPYAVGGYKNQVDAQGKPIYQTLDYSKLTPLLTAGIQGLNNKIDPFYNGISIDSTVNTSAPFMKINDVGNIGIGTMNPMAKLDINGTSTIIEIPYTPITSGSACVKGTQSWDENYLYICTASNTWKRAALSNF